MRVAADPVDDQERHAVLVGDVGRLDHPDRLLHLVAPREIGAERPMHHLDVAGLHVLDVVVAGPADSPLDHFELATVDLAGGEDEAQQLVGGLGPAVPVVRARRHLGRDHVDLPGPDEPLVVVGRVIGAGHHDAPDAFLESGAVDVVREGHVLVLCPELGVAVVLPGGGVEPRRAHEAAVDDRVRAFEVAPVTAAVGLGEVGLSYAQESGIGSVHSAEPRHRPSRTSLITQVCPQRGVVRGEALGRPVTAC